MLIPIISVALLLAVDRVTKIIAEKFLLPAGRIPLIDGIFELSFVRNKGAAFGMMQGWRWIFLIVTPLVCAGIAFFYTRLPKTKAGRAARSALVLIMAGALGNFIDRLLYGSVVDFLYFSLIDFPVFNFADICLVCGSVFFALLVIFSPKDGKLI